MTRKFSSGEQQSQNFQELREALKRERHLKNALKGLREKSRESVWGLQFPDLLSDCPGAISGWNQNRAKEVFFISPSHGNPAARPA